MQGGEVSVEHVTSFYGEELFLFSAIARPGNSGGPILSEDGHVVGIVTKELSENDPLLSNRFTPELQLRPLVVQSMNLVARSRFRLKIGNNQ